MRLHKILTFIVVFLLMGSISFAKDKTALEIFNPLTALTQFNVSNISDGTISFGATFSSATDVDTTSSTTGVHTDYGAWFKVADYPRVAVTIVVSDTQKVKVITDYRAGASGSYQTYDAAGDTISSLATTLTGKAGTVILRAYATDNIPGANYIRFRVQSITGSEYDDPYAGYLLLGQ